MTNAIGAHATLHIQGTVSSGAFILSNDGAAGTNIVICFAEGTNIDTPLGPRRVEDLAIGETVRAHFAGSAAIQWVGHRHVDCARRPEPRSVWPVRVAAGAFGPERPRRELFLSPNHAVYVGGNLIPIRLLINDVTITQEPADRITYYHVELAQHDLLSAERLLAESYLDTGDRQNFASDQEPVRLFPAFAPRLTDIAMAWEAKASAPVILRGPELEAARRWVNGLADGLPQLVDVAA